MYRNLEDHSDTVDSVAVSSTDTRPMVVSGVHSLAITANNIRPIIVSGGANLCLQLWNLDRIIGDINWERRKHFGQFVYFLRHLNEVYFHEISETSNLNNSNSYPNNTPNNIQKININPTNGALGKNIKLSSRGISLIKVFLIDNVCYHVASYL